MMAVTFKGFFAPYSLTSDTAAGPGNLDVFMLAINLEQEPMSGQEAV